jgi:hypothetical protein
MPGSSGGRSALPAVLALLGILALVAGVLYVSGAANSVPLMAGSVHHGHHLVRATAAFVAGVVLLIAAWFTARSRSGARRA